MVTMVINKQPLQVLTDTILGGQEEKSCAIRADTAPLAGTSTAYKEERKLLGR